MTIGESSKLTNRLEAIEVRLKELISFHIAPFSKETFYSLMARACHHLGYPSDAKAITKLVGDRSHQLHADLPTVCSTATKLFGIDEESTINTTMFPYYQPWLPKSKSDEIRRIMFSGLNRIPHAVAGVTGSRMHLYRPLRFCPLCASEDYNIHGTTYWHIDHQAPGVWACGRHRVQLSAIVARRSIMEIPPVEVKLPTTSYASSNDIKLAHFSSDMIFNRSTPFNTDVAATIYKLKMRDANLVTDQGRVRQRELKSRLLHFWNNLTIYKNLEGMVNSKVSTSYPSSIFFKGSLTHAPLKHLLLIGMLFKNWREFVEFYETSKAKCDEPLSVCMAPGQNFSKYHGEHSIEKAAALLKEGHSIRSSSTFSGLSFAKTKSLALNLKVDIKLRPKLLYNAERRAVWRKLHIGKSTNEIAKSLNVSVGLIEQVLTTHSYLIPLRSRIRLYKKQCHYKRMLLDYIESHPGCKRNDIRKDLPAAYLWLYKNNYHLLYELLPPEIPRELRRSSIKKP